MRKLSPSLADAIFRIFFSSIFVLLGAEHLIDDTLIQPIMPPWVPLPRLVSVASGVWLLGGGLCIATGIRIREASLALGGFLLAVTLLVHVPGMLQLPEAISRDQKWLWDLFQRSNFVKNICLLGVCVHLLTHQAGRYTLPELLRRHRSAK